MYNLIMGALDGSVGVNRMGTVDGSLGVDRMLEKVDAGLEDIVRPGGVPNRGRLMDLPTLVMPEIGDAYRAQIAQVGNIVSLMQSGRDYRFRFIRNPRIPNIPSDRI